ncbi:MAG: hypothetical protein ACPGEF_03920 [Endozoicomonas sp.]
MPANSRQLINLLSEQLFLDKYYIFDMYSRNAGRHSLMAERPVQYRRFKAPTDLAPAPLRMYEKDRSGTEIIGGQSWMPKAMEGEEVWLSISEALAVHVETTHAGIQQKRNKEVVVKWEMNVTNDQKQAVVLLLRKRDSNLIQLSDVKGAVLGKPNQIKVDVAAGSDKIISFVSIYRR